MGPGDCYRWILLSNMLHGFVFRMAIREDICIANTSDMGIAALAGIVRESYIVRSDACRLQQLMQACRIDRGRS